MPGRTAILGVIGAVLIAGCGSGVSVGPNRTVQVALSEYRLTPNSISASPGELTVVAHNYGRLSHNLTIARDGHAEASTDAIPPGGDAMLSLTVTRGTYGLSSTLLEDQDLGVEGTLHVS